MPGSNTDTSPFSPPEIIAFEPTELMVDIDGDNGLSSEYASGHSNELDFASAALGGTLDIDTHIGVDGLIEGGHHHVGGSFVDLNLPSDGYRPYANQIATAPHYGLLGGPGIKASSVHVGPKVLSIVPTAKRLVSFPISTAIELVNAGLDWYPNPAALAAMLSPTNKFGLTFPYPYPGSTGPHFLSKADPFVGGFEASGRPSEFMDGLVEGATDFLGGIMGGFSVENGAKSATPTADLFERLEGGNDISSIPSSPLHF